MIPHTYLLLTHLLMLCTALLSLNILPEDSIKSLRTCSSHHRIHSDLQTPNKNLESDQHNERTGNPTFPLESSSPSSTQWNLLLLIRNTGGLSASQQIQTGTEESLSNTGWSGEIRIPRDNHDLNEKCNGSVVYLIMTL